jgi:hypothetical protein
MRAPGKGTRTHLENTRSAPTPTLFLDLFAEDSRLNVYAGEFEVRPPGVPTSQGMLGGGGRRPNGVACYARRSPTGQFVGRERL